MDRLPAALGGEAIFVSVDAPDPSGERNLGRAFRLVDDLPVTHQHSLPPRTVTVIKMAILLKRREGMSHQEFVDYQRDTHAPILMSIPETRRFIRRFVVSTPIPAPNQSPSDYDMMVEVWFDSLDDLDAFFSSERFLKDVDPDHAKFIDLSSVVRMVCEERVDIA